MIVSRPLTVIADNREKAPYTFAGLGDVHVVRRRLITGDYSLPFLEGRIAVSRKSLADLYATLLQEDRRERFERELGRMQAMPHAAVVVEGLLLDGPPAGHDLGRRDAVVRWCATYQRLFDGVGWLTIGGRRGGELVTFAFLLAAREKLEGRTS